ncbi:hypothetical protein [Kribbella sp. HUAS MG21]|uniref:Uncharacterized protein n=1 Tax=Kribbella sp. HUAS MG21 TaxID=3160966 RepID=A0AAU7TMY5_9ACTN
MFTIPPTQESMKAEAAYRLERAKRDYRAANRRQRTAKGSHPEPRHTLRPRPAA